MASSKYTFKAIYERHSLLRRPLNGTVTAKQDEAVNNYDLMAQTMVRSVSNDCLHVTCTKKTSNLL